MKTLILVLILMVALIGVSSGLGYHTVNGRPEGFVGGTVNPDGSITGGHPSEEQMKLDGSRAGAEVTIDQYGNRVFTGPNALQFEYMDHGNWWER